MLDIDLIIFSGFLILNLFVGLFYSKGVKNISEYAIGNRDFSTGTITATIIASWLGAGFFTYTLAETYRQGLYFMIPALGDSLGFLLIGYLFAPRMGEFLGKLSVAEAMGDLFGSKVKFFTTIFSILLSMGLISIQFKVSAKILELIFGTSGLYATILSAAIIVLYSTFGGIRAVTFTDIIQFFTFGCIIPVIAVIIWGTISDHNEIWTTLSLNPSFDYKKVLDINNPKLYPMLSMIIIFLPEFTPMIFQRVAMAKNIIQTSNSFKIAGIICLMIQILVMLISVLILSDNPNLNPNDLLIYITSHYTYTGFKGLMAIGVMALIMSTADSLINSMSVIFAHDLCKPLGFKWAKHELIVSKVFAIISSSICIFLALKFEAVLSLVVTSFASYMCTVSVPFVLAIFGFRSSGTSVLVGMIAGATVFMIFSLFPIQGVYNVESYIPGVLANIIFLFGTHYLFKQPGGWIGIKDKQTLEDYKLAKKRSREKLISQILGFRFIEFCIKNSPQRDNIYSYFGFFSIVSILINSFSIPSAIRLEHWDTIYFICQSVLIISCYFLIYPLWSQKFKNKVFISILWILSLFYVLVFAPTIFLFISHLAPIQLMLFFTNMLLVSIIFMWQSALLIMIGGFITAWFSLRNYLGVEANMAQSELQVMLSVLLFSSILVAFLKPKQEHYERAELLFADTDMQLKDMSQEMLNLMVMRQEFINNINHEIRTPMHHIGSGAYAIYKDWDKYSEEQRKEFAEIVYKGYQNASHYMDDILDLSNLSINKVDLNLQSINFVKLVEDSIEKFKALYAENLEVNFKLTSKTTQPIVVCDVEKISRVIVNFLKNALIHAPGSDVEIAINDAELNYNQDLVHAIKLSVTDFGVGIPEDELFHIFGPFIQSSYTKKISGGKGVGLALCDRIIALHYGKIWAKNNEDSKGATFEFVIPKKL